MTIFPLNVLINHQHSAYDFDVIETCPSLR